ncbi:hypothetical protein SAMN05216499_101437 [Actinacidiphila paucisporea]|uniref:Uncharacterized protein n=1 Tax=Actinacidiphila paucisporea TaxID=310782 RepID=A0A1M6UP73_9ACTN|nr:hypothetical protein SAMN05216499_101437 [Actinacidiphila paucisporea]
MPPLPDGVARDPADSPGTAHTAGRRALPNLLVVMATAALGLLSAAGALPFTAADLMRFALGMVVGLNIFFLGYRLLGRFSGLAEVWTSIGVGRRLGGTVRRGRLLTFRLLPLIVVNTCQVVVDRPGLRRRMWWGTALTLLAEALSGAALIAAGGSAAAIGWGVAALTVMLVTVQPGRVTSPAWRLLRLPFGREDQRLAEWVHDPASLAAARAATAGRIDLARAALDAAEPSGSARRQAMTAVVALAEGRCDDAARTAAALRERSVSPELRRGALQLYASALADGIAAGHWSRADALPAFSAALAALRAESPAAALRGTDLAAMEALFGARPREAEKLASLAVAMAPDNLSRARALLTLAAAHTVAGRPALAGPLRAEAAALSPSLRTVR